MAHENLLKLPLSIVSPSDLKRVRRELNSLNDTLLQMEIRHEGREQDRLPKTSKLLDDLADINKLNLLHQEERNNLISLMTQLVDRAPVMHMSFSAEPSPKFLEGLMHYLRESFDPYILVTVGMAPSIGAGCIVRTTNRFFDLSLKQTLLEHREDLVKVLETSVVSDEAPQGVSA